MPLDPALKRDLPLYTLLTAVFTLPLVASLQPGSSVRVQARDLVRTLGRAILAVVQVSTAVVVGGGAILMTERGYWRVRAWLAGRRAPGEGGA
ncbi:hypothetical protein JCM10450v2_003725 [Rhodotorula kratochvilovae]